MLPAAPGRAGGSQERPPGDPVSPENTKDIVMIYEEDAEEWALYLREVFLHVVKSEAILLYRLENYSLRDLEWLSLNSYKCKLLILSDSLLKDLTPKKCQFLEKVLHSPESVVTLLCGVNSSDQLYKLLNIRGGSWEISTEQGPEDYISVIESIVFRGSEDYVQFDIPIDLRVEHPGELTERVETEELSETSRSTIPLAMVLPTEIPCENPGEIFIILRDEVIGTVEVEFTSNNKCIRIQPALWNKTAWCMKALDFPAGPINVNVYCDGVIKATTEIKYYTTEKAMERPGAAGPGDDVPQNDIEELDDILTSIFKQEIPCYEFQSLQTEIYPQKEYTHFKELPTLLHCAAKFGLKNLAVHLLQCSGASWASKMKNVEGSDPAHIAERHGHKELKKIFEDFSIQEINRDNDQEHNYEEDITSFSTCFPSTQNSAFHHESGQTHRQGAGGTEANETAKEEKENESGTEAERTLPEVGSRSSENQYDDLYMFIPGDNPESNPQESLMSIRPPLPPPRPVAAAFQLEKPHFTLQAQKMLEGQMERSQNWCDAGARQEPGGESKGEEEKTEDEREQEEEEDPYTFTEIDDNDYDMILAHMSTKKKLGGRSFIINRPPAPTPRPTNIPQKEETTPYIAQVFQQKATGRQSDGDKFHGPKKQDRGRMENPSFSIMKSCLAAGQEELILLQEKVKNGKLSVDQALEKFKHWQMGKTGLEMFQQEKLRQLRDCIIGKRPDEENVYDNLTIVHHPDGNESVHNESMLYSIPFGNKLPPRPQVEKEFGLCYRKDH